jgi:hypothetical protein
MHFGIKFPYFSFYVISLEDGRQKSGSISHRAKTDALARELAKHNIHYLGAQEVRWNRT